MKLYLSKSWTQWLLATLIFFSLSWFYMGSAVTSCSVSTAALDSDSTGGLSWSQWASGNDLSWDFTRATNYPLGEQIERPQNVTSRAVLTPYMVFSSLTSPICGINIMVLLGFMSTALVMFGLVKWLFKSSAIAMFAGYAAAFVPYRQLKATSHIFYVYGSTFIGIIWAYLWFIERPSYKRISLLALLTALSFYIDGYFILLSSVLSGTLIALLAFGQKGNKRNVRKNWLMNQFDFFVLNIKKYYKYVLWLVLLTVLFLSPVFFFQKKYASQIQSSLSSGRGNIQFEAQAYGARPKEFLVPSFNNYFVPESYVKWRLSKLHGSNVSESTLYVGWVVLILCAIAVYLLFDPKKRRINIKENIKYNYLIYTLTAVVIVCAALSLPPKINFHGIGFNSPVYYFVKITEYWRVFARLFLVIQPLLVIIATAGLYMLTKRLSKSQRAILLIVCSVLLFCEFLPKPINSARNINTDSPSVYKKILNDSNAKVLAEYPLQDLTYAPSIFTYQQLHGKPVINAHDAEILNGSYFGSIAGLGDVQTLGALKQMNVDVIIAGGINADQIFGLDQYTLPDATNRYSYKIANSVMPRRLILASDIGFSPSTTDKTQLSHRTLYQEGVMRILAVDRSSKPTGSYGVSFNTASHSAQPGTLVIKQNNKVIWSGDTGKDIQAVSFVADASLPINIYTSVSIDITDMQVFQ